jgi:predicted kinase
VPFLVLEGCDGAGKSSLATDIIQLFKALPMAEGAAKVNFQHIGPPKKIRTDQTVQDYADQEYERLMAMVTCYDPEDPDLLYVYDRFHSGAAAYGPLYRKGANMDEEFGQLGAKYFEEIEQALADRGAVSFYLLPDVDIMLERTEIATGRDEFLDDGSATAGRFSDAQTGVRSAEHQLTLAMQSGSSTAITQAIQDLAHAQLTLLDADKQAREDRRNQLVAINDRYENLMRRNGGVLHSFSGFPYYVSEEYRENNGLPEIAAETNRFRVALDMLLRAVQASDHWRTTEHDLPPLTPPVDADGLPVTI